MADTAGVFEAVNRLAPAPIGSTSANALVNTVTGAASTAALAIPGGSTAGTGIGGRWVTFTSLTTPACVVFGDSTVAAATVNDKQLPVNTEVDYFLSYRITHMRVIAFTAAGVLQWHVSSPSNP